MIWIRTEIGHIEALRTFGHLIVQFAHIITVRIDVHLIHIGFRHIQHVQVVGQLFGKFTFARCQWSFDNNDLN